MIEGVHQCKNNCAAWLHLLCAISHYLCHLEHLKCSVCAFLSFKMQSHTNRKIIKMGVVSPMRVTYHSSTPLTCSESLVLWSRAVHMAVCQLSEFGALGTGSVPSPARSVLCWYPEEMTSRNIFQLPSKTWLSGWSKICVQLSVSKFSNQKDNHVYICRIKKSTLLLRCKSAVTSYL